MQIGEELRRIARYIPGLQIATIYGGASYGRQLEDLKAGAQVVVGTPGRILDHIGRGTLKLDAVNYLILDEADRMLDMGFLPDVERILRRTPRGRQTALFSATVPTVIRILSRRYMHDPVTIHVQPQQVTVDEVEQVYYEVADRDKVEGLLSLLELDPPERAMIFRQTKIGVDRLVVTLKRRGLTVSAIHGDMSQAVREHVLREFREGRLRYLVATDVAARGLDIPEVSHVFNFDIPEDSEQYVHRIGRTARAGRSGCAMTFRRRMGCRQTAADHSHRGRPAAAQVTPDLRAALTSWRWNLRDCMGSSSPWSHRSPPTRASTKPRCAAWSISWSGPACTASGPWAPPASLRL